MTPEAVAATDPVLRKGDTVKGEYIEREADNETLPFYGIVANLDEEDLTIRVSRFGRELVLERREITRMQLGLATLSDGTPGIGLNLQF